MKLSTASGLPWMMSSTSSFATGRPPGSMPFLMKNRSSWFQLSRLVARLVPFSNEYMRTSLS